MSDEVVYHHAPKTQEHGDAETTTYALVKDEPEAVEKSDRGLFDFMGKKKEENKCDEPAAISSEFEHKVHVSEPEEPKPEEKKETLFQKMHRSNSSSSSSSDEECEDGEKKKKLKKPSKEQLQEKIEERKEKKEEENIKKHEADTHVPIEKYEEVAVPPSSTEVVHPVPTPEPEEKKGFMEKIKEKLPGGHKKVEEEHAAPPPPPTPAVVAHDDEVENKDKEKKGIFEKIKEKIPGYHSKSEEEKEKEKVKECD